MDESEWLYILDLTSLSVLPLRCGVDTSYATHIYIMIKSDGTDLFRHLSMRFLRGLVNTATSGDRVSECCNKHYKRFQTSYFFVNRFSCSPKTIKQNRANKIRQMYKAQTMLRGRTHPSYHCQQVLLQKNERLKVVGIGFRLVAKKMDPISPCQLGCQHQRDCLRIFALKMCSTFNPKFTRKRFHQKKGVFLWNSFGSKVPFANSKNA